MNPPESNWLADHFHRWGEMFDHDTRNKRAAEYLARKQHRSLWRFILSLIS